jgi:hypothetical protein
MSPTPPASRPSTSGLRTGSMVRRWTAPLDCEPFPLRVDHEGRERTGEAFLRPGRDDFWEPANGHHYGRYASLLVRHRVAIGSLQARFSHLDTRSALEFWANRKGR